MNIQILKHYIISLSLSIPTVFKTYLLQNNCNEKWKRDSTVVPSHISSKGTAHTNNNNQHISWLCRGCEIKLFGLRNPEHRATSRFILNSTLNNILLTTKTLILFYIYQTVYNSIIAICTTSMQSDLSLERVYQ